jgi:pyruvate/2-oxoglutarate dehydrogenase complex dihydrolipoamide dehydrogenase (E3) component
LEHRFELEAHLAMNYDAIVLGSGQAGNPLSQDLADLGWKVALVERGEVGGTCINTGCTPTKTMVASAQVAHYVRRSASWGVHTSGMRVDMARVVDRKNHNVHEWRTGQESRIRERAEHLHLYRGQARFSAPHKISVKGEDLESERIFINTGTRPVIPDILGLQQTKFLTNASVMDLREIPDHLLILGAGYIGLEFGQMFRRFGSQVTVLGIGEHILPREDSDISDALREVLESEGMRFVLGARTKGISENDGQVELRFEAGGREDLVRGSHLLVAVGRQPNSDDLGVETAGVELDEHGFIRVNERLETNVPGIWALGDVKGGPAFTHISFNDYQVVYGNLIQHKNVSTRNRVVPYAVYTDPELGRIGMTEQEARASKRPLKIAKIPMNWVARAIEREETAGLMKIVIDAESDKILGAAVLSTDGGELVQMLMPVMMAGLPYTVLKDAVYIHPTLAEGFWTLMDQIKAVNE